MPGGPGARIGDFLRPKGGTSANRRLAGPADRPFQTLFLFFRAAFADFQALFRFSGNFRRRAMPLA
jgi:hypothetical protein